MSSCIIRKFPRLTVELPRREIFFRLGGNLHKTRLPAAGAEFAEIVMHSAFACCQLQGRYGVLEVNSWQENGADIKGCGFWQLGKDFTARCEKCRYLWLGAVTAGRDIVTARDTRTSAAEQLIYDAVGSECADGAMDALHRLAAAELRPRGLFLAMRRYSPGYNDMPLDLQQNFFETLDMAEMDITLSKNYFMTPEKSVTAFAAISTAE